LALFEKPAKSDFHQRMKRILDVVVGGFGLLLLAPLFGAAALIIKLDSPGAVFFKQKRIGKNFRPFWIYKFRTMIEAASAARRYCLISIGSLRPCSS
jgi:lipopolysaccharide/colanic/teichoic acid biosynthesis glycosyltransferase